jgi:uncharacterized protein (TIGR03643 family)
MSVQDEHALSDEEVSHVVGMAWKDDVPFEAIEARYGLDEEAVIALMRSQLQRSSWELWRERVSGRPTKHASRESLSNATSRRPPTSRGGPQETGTLDPDDLPRNVPLDALGLHDARPAGEAPAGEGPAGEGPAGEGPAGEGPAGEGPAGEDPTGQDSTGRSSTGQG